MVVFHQTTQKSCFKALDELLWSLEVNRRLWSTFASKDISLTTSWILAKLGRNDLYIALFDDCSNDFGQHRLKIDFQDEKFKNVLVWNHKPYRFDIWYVHHLSDLYQACSNYAHYAHGS